MLKKTIKYTDFNGNERTEDHYFNLSEAELIEMEYSVKGGYNAILEEMIKSEDTPSIMKAFKNLIVKSYGKKHADGVQFEKSDAISTAFVQSNAYNALFMELVQDSSAMADFVTGLIPKDLSEKVKEIEKNKKD